MRGEYITDLVAASSMPELPPRARRILRRSGCDRLLRGTTSACAENTAADCCSRRGSRNYLRVRGEYNSWSRGCSRKRELPPRAQRIPSIFPRVIDKPGTTSACAENTHIIASFLHRIRNYLRVRGEYGNSLSQSRADKELPPRARRILIVRSTLFWPCGTTSACAENTSYLPWVADFTWNYLRVRGEYCVWIPRPSM